MVLVSPYIGIKMAQKGIVDANDILAPKDNKRDLKVRAPLVSGYLSEPSLVSSAKTACRPLSAIRMRASLAGHPTRSDCRPHHNTSPPPPPPSTGERP